MSHSDNPHAESPARDSGWRRWPVLMLLVAVAVITYMLLGDALDLEYLANRERVLRQFQVDYPFQTYAIAFAVYVAVTGLSLPGAAVLSLFYGWYFGWVPGVILVNFASTAGATSAFLLSRYLFRDAVQRRFGDRLAGFNRSLAREGPFYLFTLRLIPAVPFFIINLVMGLTPLRVRTFWWVSQLGMLPGTFVYLYAGSRVPRLQELADHGIQAVFTPGELVQLLVAFSLLGCFPLVVRLLLRHLRPIEEKSGLTQRDEIPQQHADPGAQDQHRPDQST